MRKFKVGDLVTPIVDNPYYSNTVRGDICKVTKLEKDGIFIYDRIKSSINSLNSHLCGNFEEFILLPHSEEISEGRMVDMLYNKQFSLDNIMTNAKFYELLKTMVEEEEKCMVSKGKEYTIGSDDKLQNFKDVAKASGLTVMQVWQVYFMKHIASIYNFIKDGVEASNEPIEGRIMDARNYLALLRGIIEEKKGNK